ncbi:MAG: thiamine biosynthesis protein ThiS [Deltaproteobacteria bacterium]|nr:thiamine biosynthesis protein ThiS [Deltaproteobacteria bacterium]
MSAEQSYVTVNGKEQPVPEKCTILKLLEMLGMAEKRVAVALNQDVVPRSGHAEVFLHPNDQIEILEAVGGG